MKLEGYFAPLLVKAGNHGSGSTGLRALISDVSHLYLIRLSKYPFC
jgi:hypothetical protein